MSKHGSRVHALIGSSNAATVLACRGSALMASRAPARENPAAAAGTRAHEILERRLEDKTFCYAPEGVEEEWRCTSYVIDYIDGIFAMHAGDEIDVLVEHHAYFPQNVADRSLAACYADVIVINRDIGQAWVIEYKHGEGIYVEVEGNAQLRYQAVSALWETPLDVITLVVIQPRITYKGPIIREENIDVLEMLAFQDKMERAIAAATVSNAPLTPGPHCSGCAAQVGCPAREAQMRAVLSNSPPMPVVFRADSPSTMTGEGLATWLSVDQQVRDYLKAVKNEATERLMRNMSVPGKKLVNGDSTRVFNDPPEVTARKLAELTGYQTQPEDWFEARLLGITEMEKRLTAIIADAAPAGMKKDAVKKAKLAFAFLTTKEPGGLVLADETDRREAVNRSSASAFTGVVVPPPPSI